MTREQLWKIYCDKNPQFADDNSRFTITGAGLRKLFEQTWDQAQKHKPITSSFDDFFNLGKQK